MEQPNTKNLMTYLEAAQFLGVKLPTLYSMVSRKQVPHVRFSGKMVKFDREKLVLWIKERAVEPIEEKENPL